jgi:hypothetical protein
MEIRSLMAKIRYFALILLSSLGIVQSTQAQSSLYMEDRRLFYGGIVAGANFTQIDGDRYAGYHKVGLNFGGILYAELAPQLAVSMELLYAQKGSRSHTVTNSTQGNPIAIFSYKANLDYVEIPLQLNYFDRRKSHFGAGFSYSHLINSKETANTSIGTIDLDDHPYRKFDVNFLLSGSLHLYKGLFLNARFGYSVLSIRKTAHPQLSRADEQHNNLWTVRFMYLF